MGQKIILLLDADPKIQGMIELAFTDTEYQIISLNVDKPSLEDTLEKIRNISPNMVLLDFDWSGIGGRDICQGLKTDPSLAHLPLILLVRELDNYSPEKLAGYGADRIIGKPFATEDLFRLVDEWFHPGRKPESMGRGNFPKIPDLEKWLRLVVEEKVDEILGRYLEEIVVDRLEKFFHSEECLRYLQKVILPHEQDIYENVMAYSKKAVENITGKVVLEQARMMIQQEIDRIKNVE